MSTSLFDLTVGSYSQVLGSAINFLQKGKDFCNEQGIDLAKIVETSLHENMADFHFQVVSLNHHSAKTIASLSSGEFLPPVGYERMDYDGLLAMTESSLATMQAQTPEAINALAGNPIIFKLGSNELPFTAENFVLSFSLPNFYFHATTAYDILRQQGVSIGKMDFLGSMKMGN
ncbi:MAG: DUF1993 family protein [Proteobacteria bacterium]|nr:DUF1993 family protein [Pseudomonadota bacterium]